MSYGFKSWNEDSTVAIDSTEVAVRFVATVFVERNFSGTLNIPNFDSNRGKFIVTYYYLKFNFATDVRVADSTPLTTQFVDVMNQFGTEGNRFSSTPPTLVWDNTAKTLSVTPNSPVLADFQITFIHYK